MLIVSVSVMSTSVSVTTCLILRVCLVVPQTLAEVASERMCSFSPVRIETSDTYH